MRLGHCVSLEDYSLLRVLDTVRLRTWRKFRDESLIKEDK
jgi:hypothetical protein